MCGVFGPMSGAADIVPDDVDAEELHARMRASSSTDRADRKRCPGCGTPEIFNRTVFDTGTHVRGGPAATDDHDYRCTKCGERFDDPVVGTAEEVDG